LAAGGISAALVIPDGSGNSGNIITAGHLQVEINQGEGSDLSIDNLAPGDSRVAYQLITGDMAGVDSAALSMTLSSALDTPFTQNSNFAVAVSEPASEADLAWSSADQICSAASGGFMDRLSVAAISSLTSEQTLDLGALTGAHDAVCVRFTIGLNQSAGNPVQGTDGTLSMTYNLSQNTAATP
jgi:hypothetical protein